MLEKGVKHGLIIGLLAVMFPIFAAMGLHEASFFHSSVDPLYATVRIVDKDDGVGTGVFVGPNTIITAGHVVEGFDAASLKVTRAHDGKEIKASVVAQFHMKDIDFAVVITEDATDQWLSVDCAPLNVRDKLIGYGHPLGASLIAAGAMVARVDPFKWGSVPDWAVTIEGLLMQGMSGGPLMNTGGKVVGLYVSMAGTSSFMGPVAPYGYGWIVPASKFCALMPATK